MSALALRNSLRTNGKAALAPVRGGKRDAILNAGLRLFATLPYQDVTMDRVAEEAGVAKGTLYLYFKSKESLYSGIIRDGTKAATRCYQAEFDPNASVLDRLTQVISVSVAFYSERPDLLRLLATSEPRPAALRDRAIGGWRERGMRFITALIEEGIASGTFRRCDPRMATLAILGSIRTVLLYYGPRRPAARVGCELAEILTRGLLAAKPARTRANR